MNIKSMFMGRERRKMEEEKRREKKKKSQDLKLESVKMEVQLFAKIAFLSC